MIRKRRGRPPAPRVNAGLKASAAWKKSHIVGSTEFRDWLQAAGLTKADRYEKDILRDIFTDSLAQFEAEMGNHLATGQPLRFRPYDPLWMKALADAGELNPRILRVYCWVRCSLVTAEVREATTMLLAMQDDPEALKRIFTDRMDLPLILAVAQRYAQPEAFSSYTDALARSLLVALPALLSRRNAHLAEFATIEHATEFMKYLHAAPEEPLPIEKLFRSFVAKRHARYARNSQAIAALDSRLTILEKTKKLIQILEGSPTLHAIVESDPPFDEGKWRAFRTVLRTPMIAWRSLLRALRRSDDTVRSHLHWAVEELRAEVEHRLGRAK